VPSTDTPQTLTPEIEEFCEQLAPGSSPVYLDVEPTSWAQPLDCYLNVERQIAERGGEVQYGWQIWEWRGVYLDAEFHAVWKDPHGKLHDITPKNDPTLRILFLPDATRVYTGSLIRNQFYALGSEPEVLEYIAASNALQDFWARPQVAQSVGVVRLTGTDAAEYRKLLERSQRARARLMAMPASKRLVPKLGRNDPCWCGSQMKFKKCHWPQAL
jgi:hypothetical protein